PHRFGGLTRRSDEADRLLQASAYVEQLVAADVARAGYALTKHHAQGAAPHDDDRSAAHLAERDDRLIEIVVGDDDDSAAEAHLRRTGDHAHARQQCGDRSAAVDAPPDDLAAPEAHDLGEVLRHHPVQPRRTE